MPVVPNIPLSPHAEETITKANTKVPLAVHVPALGLCGLVASALVAPFVGIIDAAIVRNASKQTGLLTGTAKKTVVAIAHTVRRGTHRI